MMFRRKRTANGLATGQPGEGEETSIEALIVFQVDHADPGYANAGIPVNFDGSLLRGNIVVVDMAGREINIVYSALFNRGGDSGIIRDGTEGETFDADLAFEIEHN